MTQETNIATNIAMALSKAQGAMKGAKKSSDNPYFKSTYADLSSVFEAIREPFSQNGLSVTQTIDILESEKQILCTRLMHICGEFIDSKMLLPVESNPQKLGSLITYYRRYSLMAICGLAAEDDDGNAASMPNDTKTSTVVKKSPKQASVSQNDDCETENTETISDEQYKELEKYIESDLALRQNTIAFMKKKWGIETLQDMPLVIYESVLKSAKRRRSEKKESLELQEKVVA